MLIVIAITGTTAPLWGRIQQRLTPDIEDETLRWTALRQGLWLGLFVAALIFFRISGLLDWILVLVLGFLFVLLETFLQQRKQWREMRVSNKPKKQQPVTQMARKAKSAGGKGEKK